MTVLFMISAGGTGGEKTNFLLVTIDTWRADYISCSGSGRVHTPFLDRLAAEGCYINTLETPCPITTPAHASILTGLYPVNHGIRTNSHFKLKEGAVTLAQLFKQAGYETIAVVSAVPLKKTYGLNRGFDIYDDEEIGEEGEEFLGNGSRDCLESCERALTHYGKTNGKGTFIWLHLYDPHTPYEPPREYLNRYPRDPYAGEVAYVDDTLRDFVTRLLDDKKRKWTILVTGDHGEGLGEKGEMAHGLLLFRQTRNVPLLLWNNFGEKKTFGNGLKSLIDIFPAVVDLFSLKKTGCDGISLFADTRGTRWLYSESFHPTMNFGLNPAFMARNDELILIKHGTSTEVYAGSDEDHDVAGKNESFKDAAKKNIYKFFGENRIPSPNLELKESDMEALAGLGYIGSYSAPERTSSCDLRAFSKDYETLGAGVSRETSAGNFSRALKLFDEVIKNYPNSSILYFEKGKLLERMKRYDDAVTQHIACLKIDPSYCPAIVSLGAIMELKGDVNKAEKYYLTAIKFNEGFATAHLNLGILLSNDPKKRQYAKKHLEIFVKLAPKASQTRQVKELLKTL